MLLVARRRPAGCAPTRDECFFLRQRSSDKRPRHRRCGDAQASSIEPSIAQVVHGGVASLSELHDERQLAVSDLRWLAALRRFWRERLAFLQLGEPAANRRLANAKAAGAEDRAFACGLVVSDDSRAEVHRKWSRHQRVRSRPPSFFDRTIDRCARRCTDSDRVLHRQHRQREDIPVLQ